MQFACHNPQKYPFSPHSLQHLKWLEHLNRAQRVVAWHPTWNSVFLNNYNNLLFIRRKIAFKYHLILTSTSTYLHIYTSTYFHLHDVLIDLFTDTAAILNFLDLRGIMGCPGGMSTIRCTRISINARFSGPFFFNIFLKKRF